MLAIKIWYHLLACLEKVLFKILYGKSLKIGQNVTWRRNFSIMKEKNAIIVIGDNCFFNNDCSIAANNCVEIGEGCLFGENVKIYDHNHKFNKDVPIKVQGFSNGEVHIGSHCWIGSNVTLLKGTYIDNNCVIGAGCVINGYLPEGSIVKNKTNYSVVSIK